MFRPGDKAKILPTHRQWNVSDEGKIVEVLEVWLNSEICTVRYEDGFTWAIHTTHLEPLDKPLP